MRQGQESMIAMSIDDRWASYRARYSSGEWRSPLFRDMILDDVHRSGTRPTILDIGCGDGLDGEITLQRTIAQAAGRFIGIEPDRKVILGDHFSETHRCLFEDAPIPPGSVDLAYAIMVLEHLPSPQLFWDKLHEVLADGGVFWGLTVDARHLFSRLSLWSGRLRIKNSYLDFMLGRTEQDARYKNYPTYYRSNTPPEIARLASAFRSCECVNFSRVGQWSPYLPKPIRRFADELDRRSIRNGRPGTLMIVRAVR
jgi:SAM-dependent methyltransferase